MRPASKAATTRDGAKSNSIILNRYPVPPGVTKIMGVEFAGVIEQVGHGTEEEERHHWKEGDEVFGLAYGGAYAEYVAVSKKMLIRKPKELSWEVCGGVCEVSSIRHPLGFSRRVQYSCS